MDDDLSGLDSVPDNLAPDKLHIVDAPLPDALNFAVLKGLGIAHLQRLAGKVWTNYNETDPGVTILDQLCYALTELGYCAQFPIADVLTQEDGKIHYRDQFFDPQSILTCSAITIDDYRRLVIDRVAEVRAIYFYPETVPMQLPDGAAAMLTGRYKAYLKATEQVLPFDRAQLERVCARVYVLLNEHRNLGELFLLPQVLIAKPIMLAGSLTLCQNADGAIVRGRIMQALREYEAPLARQSGYAQLRADGLRPDQIFNGPKLRHGWIAGDDAMEGKCDSVSLLQLRSIIASVVGVSSVQALSVADEAHLSSIDIAQTEVADILLGPDFLFMQNGASITSASAGAGCGGPAQTSHGYLARLRAKHQAAGVASSVDLAPPLPAGRYRNIEQYYSVQNTFPDMYGIGHNALPSDASSARIAGVRQLKGYLMMFDQLLANQFSQLANIGNLLSFGPPHGKPQQWQRQMPQSGIANNSFATTYYYQPLYDVPNVRPLLRGHDVFRYQFDPKLPVELAELQAWRKFVQFPNNHYILGLRQYMESDSEANSRRDRILSHLMARQGDQASRYEQMINTCQWYGGTIQTLIIVKSIWLQNYQIMSYNRTKGFDFPSARPLVRLHPAKHVTNDIFLALQIRSGKEVQLRSKTAMPWWSYPAYPSKDGAVDQTMIYADAKIRKADINNFSTFELTVGIMINLSAHLLALAGRLYALLDDGRFAVWLAQADTQKTPFKLPHSDVSVRVNMLSTGENGRGRDQLFEGERCLMDIAWLPSPPDSPIPPTPADYLAHANQLIWLASQRKGFLLIEHILLALTPAPAHDATGSAPHPGAMDDVAQYLNASLIFPGYVTLIQQPSFRTFIDTLLDLHWPAHVVANYKTVSFVVMQGIIALFITWYNNLENTDVRAQASRHLANFLKPSVQSGGMHAN